MNLDTPTYFRLVAINGMVEPFAEVNKLGVMIEHNYNERNLP